MLSKEGAHVRGSGGVGFVPFVVAAAVSVVAVFMVVCGCGGGGGVVV